MVAERPRTAFFCMYLRSQQLCRCVPAKQSQQDKDAPAPSIHYSQSPNMRTFDSLIRTAHLQPVFSIALAHRRPTRPPNGRPGRTPPSSHPPAEPLRGFPDALPRPPRTVPQPHGRVPGLLPGSDGPRPETGARDGEAPRRHDAGEGSEGATTPRARESGGAAREIRRQESPALLSYIGALLLPGSGAVENISASVHTSLHSRRTNPPPTNPAQAIHCSTMLRARETAELIAQSFPGVPVLPTDLLREASKRKQRAIGHTIHRISEARRTCILLLHCAQTRPWALSLPCVVPTACVPAHIPAPPPCCRRRHLTPPRSTPPRAPQGAPCRPEPDTWKPREDTVFQDSARIEAAFRSLFYREVPGDSSSAAAAGAKADKGKAAAAARCASGGAHAIIRVR